MFCVEQELESVKTKVNQTDELQDQVSSNTVKALSHVLFLFLFF